MSGWPANANARSTHYPFGVKFHLHISNPRAQRGHQHRMRVALVPVMVRLDNKNKHNNRLCSQASSEMPSTS